MFNHFVPQTKRSKEDLFQKIEEGIFERMNRNNLTWQRIHTRVTLKRIASSCEILVCSRRNFFDPVRPWPWRSEPGAEQFTEPQTRYSVPRNGSNYLASWTGGKWPWLVGPKPRARERVLVTTDPAALRPPFPPYAKLTRQTFAWIRKWADPWIVHIYLRSGHRLLDRAIMDLAHVFPWKMAIVVKFD